MSGSAEVTSFDALRRFAIQLADYGRAMQDALAALNLKTGRAVEWIETVQPAYWTTELRRASECLTEALDHLQQKQLAIRPEDRPSCYEERKTVERVRRRLRYAESRLSNTRKWCPRVRNQGEEFRTIVAKLSDLIERDIPRARAALDRRLHALEKYARSRKGEA